MAAKSGKETKICRGYITTKCKALPTEPVSPSVSVRVYLPVCLQGIYICRYWEWIVMDMVRISASKMHGSVRCYPLQNTVWTGKSKKFLICDIY